MTDANLNKIVQLRLEKTAKALESNNMTAFIVQTKEEAAEKVKSLIKKGDVITSGGSVTLNECGIIDMVKSPDYCYLDRNAVPPEEVEDIYRKAFTADVYLSSANAITENGELYNVDGNSNRVAAIAYGPESVIIVAGYNKIVGSLDEAANRVKKTAAPSNTVRLNCDTYCAKTGECAAFAGKCPEEMTSGCSSDARICCNYLISAKQRHKGRIKVILVAENLGF
ncbi:MAG: lactate utilization protein [Oscillospiraceae bacterium]|nr:lactate utilization protein [Oscillospiraceae bacterium]